MKNQMQSHRCGDLGYGSQAAPMALHRIILVVLRDAGAAFDSILVDQSGPSQPNLQRHGEGHMTLLYLQVSICDGAGVWSLQKECQALGEPEQ